MQLSGSMGDNNSLQPLPTPLPHPPAACAEPAAAATPRCVRNQCLYSVHGLHAHWHMASVSLTFPAWKAPDGCVTYLSSCLNITLIPYLTTSCSMTPRTMKWTGGVVSFFGFKVVPQQQVHKWASGWWRWCLFACFYQHMHPFAC